MIHAEIRRKIVSLLPRLRRFAITLSGAPDRADDLVQNTVERALSRLDQLAPDTPLDRWMFKIMKTVHLNTRRAAVTRRTENIDDHGDHHALDGTEVVEAKLTLAEVRRNFEKLPEEQRQALLLVTVEGYSYTDAADFLGVPMGTVISRVARGRAAIMSKTNDEPANVALFPKKALR